MTYTEYLPAHSEQAIANVDQALAWVGLKTYTQLCDQLAELAEVAIRDNGRLEQQIVELRRELLIISTLQLGGDHQTKGEMK